MINFLYFLGGLLILLSLLYTSFRIAVRRGGRKVVSVDPTAWIIQPEEDSTVVRDLDGNLHISWQEPTDHVEIIVSTTPEGFDDAPQVQAEFETQSTTIQGLDPGTRYYFNLKFGDGDADGGHLVAAERFLHLKSVANLRDLGGYRTIDGRTVRWGRVYRSGELSKLNQEDMSFLERLGIKLVCDLRNSREAKSRPDRLAPGVRSLHCPVYEDEFTKLITPKILFKRHELGNTLGSGYTDWLDIGAGSYGRLFTVLADPENLPLLFHCTAGKDRAGIGVAILLSLLGVPDETIIADYSLSNLAFDHLYADFLVDNRTDRLGISGEEVKIMLAANPTWIKSTLNRLWNDFGGAEAFLVDAAGLSQGQTEAIRENFLTDP